MILEDFGSKSRVIIEREKASNLSFFFFFVYNIKEIEKNLTKTV